MRCQGGCGNNAVNPYYLVGKFRARVCPDCVKEFLSRREFKLYPRIEKYLNGSAVELNDDELDSELTGIQTLEHLHLDA